MFKKRTRPLQRVQEELLWEHSHHDDGEQEAHPQDEEDLPEKFWRVRLLLGSFGGK